MSRDGYSLATNQYHPYLVIHPYILDRRAVIERFPGLLFSIRVTRAGRMQHATSTLAHPTNAQSIRSQSQYLGECGKRANHPE